MTTHILITGASRGIGAAAAAALATDTTRVVALSSADGDLNDPAVPERLWQQSLDRLDGRIDTLVNNAGIFVARPFTSYTAEQYADVVSTNINGFFHITQHAIEAMEKQGRGHVVSITTSLVDHPNSNVPSVLASLSKGGINAATKSLAIEYAKRGIRVNAVSPGVIKTPMHTPDSYDFLGSIHPMNRMGEISDVVDAILYLEKAPYVTGEILHVDGGQSAGL